MTSSRNRLGHVCGTVVAVTSSLALASCELETKEQRLAKAARGIDIVSVERLLAEGADPNSKDANGVTPLLIAAERGDVLSVEALIKRGAAVNSVDVHGRTPLMLSAWSFRAVVVDALLRHGADPCLKSGDGRTALEGSLLAGNQPDASAVQRRQVIETLKAVNCDDKRPVQASAPPAPPPARAGYEVRSDASFGPNSPFIVVDRRQLRTVKELDYLVEVEELLSRGATMEQQGHLDAALVAYTLASATASVAGLDYAPISLALYRMEVLNVSRPEFPFTAFRAKSVYDRLGRQVLVDTVADIAATHMREHNTTSASVVDEFLKFIGATERYDSLVVWKGLGLVVLGRDHLRLLARAVLGYGLIMSDGGRWSLLTPSDLPGQPESWQIEDRGILKNRAFRLDQTRAFIPGIKSLVPDHVWKAARLPDAGFLMARSVWEFALMGTAFADIREAAYTASLAGSVAEIAGKKAEAVQAYQRALAIGMAGGYSEPVLKIDMLGGAAGSLDRDLAATLRERNQRIELIQATILRQHSLSSARMNERSRAELLASLQHSVFVRDMLLGRGVVTASPRPPAGPLDDTERVVLLGRGFVDQWTEGMRSWGVRLMDDEWKVEPLRPEDWNNATFVSSGYWKGYSRDADGMILVAGLSRMQALTP